MSRQLDALGGDVKSARERAAVLCDEGRLPRGEAAKRPAGAAAGAVIIVLLIVAALYWWFWGHR